MFEKGTINLGAPVLAVQTAISLGASDDSNNYTPIKIVNPSYSQSN